MAYCSKEDLLKLVSYNSEMNRLVASSDSEDIAVVTGIIQSASELIDSYIGVQNNANSLIKMLNCKIAIYWLFQRINSEVPESVTNAYYETIQTLKAMDKRELQQPEGYKSLHDPVVYPKNIEPIPYLDLP